MALTVSDSRILDFSDAESSAAGNRYTVVYRVTANKMAPGIFLANAALAATPHPMPSPGQALNLTFDGETYADAASFAREFNCSSLFSTNRITTAQDITVRYLPDGLPTSQPNRTDPLANTNPLSHPVRRSLEWMTEQEIVTAAKNVQALRDRPANTLGPITNAAGAPVREPFYEQVRKPVLVLKKNVTNYLSAITLYLNWRKTTNNGVWSGIPARQARFVDVDVTGPEYWNQIEYYEARIRVAVSDVPWYLRVDNVGSWYYLAAAGGSPTKTVVDSAGIWGTDQQVMLDYDGVNSSSQNEIEYAHLNEADYDALDTAIDAL